MEDELRPPGHDDVDVDSQIVEKERNGNEKLAKSRSRSKSRSSKSSRSRSRSRKRSKKKHRRHRSSSSESSSRSRSRSRKRSRRKRSRSKSKSHTRSRSRSRSRHKRRHRSPSYSPAPYRGGGGGGGGGGGYYNSRNFFGSGPRSRYVGPRDAPAPSRCLGIFGMNVNTTESTLERYFSGFGRIDKVQIVYDAKTGRSRGFSFIYFENVDDAVEAKEHSTGVEIDGFRIRCDYSLTNRPHTPTPGIYMGNRRDYYDRSPSPRRHSKRRSRSRSYS